MWASNRTPLHQRIELAALRRRHCENAALDEFHEFHSGS
jgi:hypothetical protein